MVVLTGQNGCVLQGVEETLLWQGHHHDTGVGHGVREFWGEGSRGGVQSWRTPASWGLGQFNGPSNVQMSWFEAVNGESLRFTTHVHHKMFVSRLQNTEWALVGRA